MSSADLHNEDGFSNERRRMAPLRGLLGAADHVSPKMFFREILRRFGPACVRRQDVDRALFLFDRVQRAKGRVYCAGTGFAAALVIPIGSFFVIDPFRWPAFLTGVGLEILLGVFFSSARRCLIQRRKDYQVWLSLVHRTAQSRPNTGESRG